MKRLAFIFFLLCAWPIWAAEVMPPKPPMFFNDYAHIISPRTASQLDEDLKNFERQTSSQIWVVIYPKMQSDSSIDDYAVRVVRSWKTGDKGKNNGAILFIFVEDHKMTIQVGYGLEGAMPDAVAKRIIADEITPYFKRGDFDDGLKAGVAAMMAATKGEYKGTGQTVAEATGRGRGTHSNLWLIIIVIIVALIFSSRRRGMAGLATGWMLGSGGFGGWSSGGGGGWSGGGGGGGDEAMGGGGSFGGGGASGSW